MIVRVLGEGQFDVPEDSAARLETLDGDLLAAVEAGDEDKFRNVLLTLLAEVRGAGSAVPAGELVPSDLVLPDSESSLDDVKRMMVED
jgi:hypothetical protein